MSIKVRNENRELEEVYSKDEVYSKSETDNIQTATITLSPTDTAKGKAEITFKRVGRVVYVQMVMYLYANYDFCQFLKVFEIPEFAKIKATNDTLMQGNTISSIGQESDGGLELNDFCRGSIVVADGTYKFLGIMWNDTVQTTDTKRTITGCYITDID